MPKLAGAPARPTYRLDELLVDYFLVFASGKFRCCVTGCDTIWDGMAQDGGRVVLAAEVGPGKDPRPVGEICKRHVDELTAQDQPKRPEWVLGPATVHVDGLADAYAAGWVEGRCSSGNHGPEPSPSDVAAEFGLWCDKIGLTETDQPESPKAARVAHHTANLNVLLGMLAREEIYVEDLDPDLLRRLGAALKYPPF